MANDTPNQSVLNYLEKAGHYLQTVRDIMDNSPTSSIQQISTQVVTMNDLGDEELLHVLSQLPVMVDLFRCTRVCRRWNRVIRSTIGKHGFKCTKVMSTTTLGREVGLSDLLQILQKVGPQVRRLELDGLAVISYTNSFMWEQFRSLLMGMPHLEHLGIQFEIVDSYALLALVLLFPKPQQIKSLHIRQESIVKVKPYGRIQYGTLQKSQYRQLVYFDEYDVDEAESEARKQYLSRDKPEVPLLIKFLRHFSSLKELHLYGFMSRRGITMDFLDWPSGLQVLQIEGGVDVGFPYYRWLLYVDVFARLAECCPHLRELRIIVSSSCFVLKDLLKLIRNLEKLDITFANYEDKKSYEPDYELETGILSIAPNLSFLRINSVGMITRAILSALSSTGAPHLRKLELFGRTTRDMLEPLCGSPLRFPLLEYLSFSGVADDVDDVAMATVFTSNPGITEFHLHFARNLTTRTVQDLLFYCERLERLELFEVEKISSSSPNELRDIILAELRKRKLRNGDNFLPLHIFADTSLAKNLAEGVDSAPGSSCSILELSKHRYMFLKYTCDPESYDYLIRNFCPRVLNDGYDLYEGFCSYADYWISDNNGT